jgi:hypothetical protein
VNPPELYKDVWQAACYENDLSILISIIPAMLSARLLASSDLVPENNSSMVDLNNFSHAENS